MCVHTLTLEPQLFLLVRSVLSRLACCHLLLPSNSLLSYLLDLIELRGQLLIFQYWSSPSRSSTYASGYNSITLLD